MAPLDRLLLTPPIPYAATQANFGTAAQTFSGTNAAQYMTSGSGSSTANLGNAETGCCAFVSVHNLHSSNVIYVNVGNTMAVPPAATLGGWPIPAGGSRTFACITAGTRGVQPVVSVLAGGANTPGSIHFHQ